MPEFVFTMHNVRKKLGEKLVLDNVTMTSTVTSPIIVTAADEVVIILADGSTNTVTDTSAHRRCQRARVAGARASRPACAA